MSVDISSQMPLSLSSNLELVDNHSSGLMLGLGAELVFTQDAAGCYLSFYWQKAKCLGLKPEEIVGHSLNQTFGPVESSAYLERVQRILESLVPERCQCVFCYEQKFLGLS